MNYSDYRFTLDVQIHQAQVSVPVTFGDTGRKLCIGLTDGRKPYVIADGCRAVFNAKKPDGNVIKNDCIIERNVILYEFTEQTTNAEGIVYCDITLYDTDGKVLTSPQFIIVVDKRVVRDAELIATLSTSQSTALDRIFTSEQERQTTFESNEETRQTTFNNAEAERKAKFDKFDLVQTPGNSTTKAMSQKAVTKYVPKVKTRNLMTLTFENAMRGTNDGIFTRVGSDWNAYGKSYAASPDYIEVAGGETYTFSWKTDDIMPHMYVHTYDADGAWIGKFETSTGNKASYTVQVADNCRYVSISFYRADTAWEELPLDEFQMECGGVATEYVLPEIISPDVLPPEAFGIEKVISDGIDKTNGSVDAISDNFIPSTTVAYASGDGKMNVSTQTIFVGWFVPIKKECFPYRTVGVTLGLTSNVSEINVVLELYDQNRKLITRLAEETLTLPPWSYNESYYTKVHTFDCEILSSWIKTDVAYIGVYIPNTTSSSIEGLSVCKVTNPREDIDVATTPLCYMRKGETSWVGDGYASGEPRPDTSSIQLIRPSTKLIPFDFESYGLPVLEFEGDVSKMNASKNEVDLTYKYGDRAGSCTLKWQGSSSVAYPKKNYTVKFDSKFEAKEGWGEQKKYCLKANYIDFSHSRNIGCAKLWSEVVKSRTPANETLNALVNGGAIDGFPICLVINGEYQGIYTFNIPKDGWMFGMGDGTHEAILCADNVADVCSFKALATLDGDFEVEYATDEDDTEWIKTSVNRLIQACIDSDGTDLDTTIAQYLDWESAIDYYIFCVLSNHYDGVIKNYLLVTYDGTKWFFSAYDMDSTFGLETNGSKFRTATGDFNVAYLAWRHRVFGLINKYKTDELKARYNELVNGVLSEEAVIETFTNFAGSIPKALFDEEVKIWSTLPSTSVNNVSQIIDFNRRRRAYIDPQIEKL